MNKLYKIKPLEWTGNLDESYSTLCANTPFGQYSIGYDDRIFRKALYYAHYNFDDWYDEDTKFFDTVQECRDWCESDWLDRISEFLDEVPEE